MLEVPTYCLNNFVHYIFIYFLQQTEAYFRLFFEVFIIIRLYFAGKSNK